MRRERESSGMEFSKRFFTPFPSFTSRYNRMQMGFFGNTFYKTHYNLLQLNLNIKRRRVEFKVQLAVELSSSFLFLALVLLCPFFPQFS